MNEAQRTLRLRMQGADFPTEDQLFVVEGEVVRPNGAPLAEYVVIAYDRGLCDWRKLGDQDLITRTNDLGRYRIEYNPVQLRALGKTRADLQVRVFDPQTGDTVLATSPLYLQALPRERVDFSIGKGHYRGPDEFTRVQQAIVPLIESPKDLPCLTTADVYILARAAEIPVSNAAYYVKAQRWAQQQGLPAPVYYAFFRRNLPLERSALFARPWSELWDTLEKARRRNLIDIPLDDELRAQLAKAQQQYLAQPDHPYRRLLDTTGLESQQQEVFTQRLMAGKDTGDEFWKALVVEDGFSTEQVTELKDTFELQAFTGGSPTLAAHLRSSWNVRQPRDVAAFSPGEWQEIVSDKAVEIPDDILLGQTDEVRQEAYAHLLFSTAEVNYPTPSLVAQMGRSETWQDKPLTESLAQVPDFAFEEQRVEQLLREHPEVLKPFPDPEQGRLELRRIEQLFHLTPREQKTHTIEALWKTNLQSAPQIAGVGRHHLLRQVNGEISRPVADQIYQNALQITATSMVVYSLYQPNLTGPRTYGLRGRELPRPVGLSPEQELAFAASALPEWSELFGSADACEVPHWNSVYGPGAYLIEILFYLQRAVDRDGKNGLEHLLEIRPDIGKLQLTQANAETVMPYIDIVNEIMEEIIAAGGDGKTIPTTGFGQTTWEGELLEAQRENFNSAAYQILREAVYPFPALPFNLWLTEGRRYLEQMEIDRHELMKALPAASGGNAATIAAEGLGLSLAELQVIRTPRRQLAALANLWGIDRSKGPLLNQLRQVDTFLRQAQIEYDDLLRLLNTPFLNPDRQIGVEFAGDPCSLDGAVLASADGSALPDETLLAFLDRTHRFLRLQKRLEWSIYELDQVTRTLGVNDFGDAGVFPGLAAIAGLRDSLDLPIPEMCSLWADLDTYEYEEEVPAQYEAVFLNPVLLADAHSGEGPDLFNDVFALTADRTDLVITTSTDPNLSPWLAESDGAEPPVYTLNPDYAAYIQAVTGLTGADLETLVVDALPKNGDGHVALNLGNVSLLYRIASFTQALRISVQDFQRLLSLGWQWPLTVPGREVPPTKTDEFFELFEAVDDWAWSVEELAYLLLHESEAAAVYGPLSEEVEALLGELSSGFAGLADTQEAIDSARDNPEARSAVSLSLGAALGLDGALLEELLFLHRPALGFGLMDVLILHANPDLTSLPEPPVEFEQLYELLHKFTLAWNPLELDAAHLAFVLDRGPELGWMDLLAFPLEARPEADFQPWYRLEQAAGLQVSIFTDESSLFSLIEEAYAGTLTREEYLQQASEWTGWNATDLTYLAGPDGFDLGYPGDFQDETGLARLHQAMEVVQPTGVPAEQVHTWTKPDLEYSDTQSIRQALRLSYDSESWLEVLAGMQDELRNLQRDALLGYLLSGLGGKDSRAFYNHYLLDPEVDSCAKTTRIVLAHNTVQLFVQRILMNMEGSLAFTHEDGEGWKWRQNYRVWEAARKIFFTPENFMEPELRDDQSIFFREFEEGLLQVEVTHENVEDLFHSYLLKLDQVSRLEITGMYRDEQTGILHIFGSTKDLPNQHFYRRWENQTRWTSWERMNLEIESEYLIPITYNGRLYVFWPEMTITQNEDYTFSTGSNPNADEEEELRQQIRDLERRLGEIEAELAVLYSHPKPDDVSDRINDLEAEKADINEDLDELDEELTSLENTPPPPVVKRYTIEMSMSWSEYRSGAWSAKTQSEVTITYQTDASLYRQCFTGWVSSDHSLKIAIRTENYGMGADSEPEYIGHFYFDDCQGKLQYSNEEASGTPVGEVTVSGGLPWYNTVTWGSPTYSVEYLELKVNGGTEARKLIHSGGTLYYPHQYGHGGGEMAPFFFSDGERTFFVQPQWSWLSSNWEYQLPVNGSSRIASNSTGSVGQRAVAFTSTNSHYQDAGDLIVDRNYELADEFVISTQGGQIDRILTEIDLVNQLPSPQDGDFHYKFTRFYHPYTCLYLRQLFRLGVEGLLNPDPDDPSEDSINLYRQETPLETFDFDKTYKPESWVSTPYPTNEIDFDPDSPWGVYNWEVFFHIPLLVATRLMADQRFDEARRWFHYFFDPQNTEGKTPERFWKVKPFYDEQQMGPTETMQELIDLLEQGNYQLEQQVQAWLVDPFNPFAIARMRIAAYMRNAFMKHLDLLIAEGDYHFYLDTMESVNRATQLYILAADLLGEEPDVLPEQEQTIYTANQLLGRVSIPTDILVPRNPLEELTSLFPTSLPGAPRTRTTLPTNNGQTVIGLGGVDSLSTFWQFGIPYNEKLYGYWDLVADRLFKIRHCMNIAGQVRQLPPYALPIDPALLVRASAAGLEISSVLSSLYAPRPHYRFTTMLAKALDFCAEVRNLGAAVLATIEKGDAEEMALLRTRHGINLFNANRSIKEQQIREAEENIAAQQKSLDLVNARRDHYTALLEKGLSRHEEKHLDLMKNANLVQTLTQGAEQLASVLYAIPQAILPAGSEFGGLQLGQAAQSGARLGGIISIDMSYQANRSSIGGGNKRRSDEWRFQKEQATREIDQVEKHLLAAEIRLAIAEKDLETLEQQTDQEQEVENFLQMKFSNSQLYSWMLSKLSAAYFQAYQLAYQLARQAQQALEQDLGMTPGSASYIQPTYWDSLKKGLLAGEQLSLDLKRMEAAYIEQNIRELELTRHISLRQLDPLALLTLKATGTCEVTLPEWLLDLDNAGHYKRRIKHVSLSIPSVTGPYTSLNCTLTLLNSTVRTSSLLTGGLYPRQEGEDQRFSDYAGAIQSIVTSSGSNDSGLFEPNLHDERYLPFEGAGAISTWRLELPTAFRQFDYNSISDVILHLRYTARSGGAPLAEAAVQNLETLVESTESSGLALLFSLKHDLSTDWHRFVSGTGDFQATFRRDYFPYFTQGREVELERVQLYAVQDGEVLSETPTGLNLAALTTALEEEGEFVLTLPADDEVLVRDKAAYVFVLLGYSLRTE